MNSSSNDRAQQGSRIELLMPSELRKNGWDQLVGPDDVFLGTDWQAIVEQTADSWLGYLIASSDRPIAGLAMALASAEVPWPMGRPDVILSGALADSREDANQAALRLGCPEGMNLSQRLLPSLTLGGRHLGHTRAVGSALSLPLLDSLLIRAEAVADDLGARSVSVPFLDASDDILARALEERGYVSFEVDEYSVLDVPDGGFDEYLTRLSGHRRREVLRERRRNKEAGLKVGLRRLDQLDHTDLARLEIALLAKYGTSWAPANSLRWLEMIDSIAGSRAGAVVGTAEGKIRSFAVVYQHRDRWVVRQAGFDYEWQRAARGALYFETIFYTMLEEAHESGVHRIHYGLSSGDAKRSRGCRSSQQRCWIALR